MIQELFLGTMISELENSPFFESFSKFVQEKPSLLIEGLSGGAKAALIHFLQKATKRNILIITGHERQSQLMNDLPFFTHSDPIFFPAWEALPGEEVSPSHDIMGLRMSLLEELEKSTKPEIVITPLQGILQKVLAPKDLKQLSETLKKGDETPFEEMAPLLTSLGFTRSKIVSDKGEFAIRGGIVDLFPIHMQEPIRLEFFGDTVEEIRTFGPMSQKSTGKITSFSFSYADEETKLRTGELATLFDYFQGDVHVVLDDLLALEDRLVGLKSMPGYASKLMTPEESFFNKITTLPHLFLPHEMLETLSSVDHHKKSGRGFYSGKDTPEPLTFSVFNRSFQSARMGHPFQKVQEYFDVEGNSLEEVQQGLIQAFAHQIKPESRLYFLSETDQEEKMLREKLFPVEENLPKNIGYERGYLSEGFALVTGSLFVVPFTEWTKRLKVSRQKWRNTSHTPASEFHELSVGDPVVHFHNGIGIFRGIEKQKNHQGVQSEFLVIEYAGKSKLFVPISQSHLVSRYIGASEEKPTLHQLGSSKWQKTKEGVQKAIIGYAKDLLTAQAEREVKGGFACRTNSDSFEQFSQAFMYEETEDQLNAIQDIVSDMQSEQAMDRLVCGDVGYGKTEVAMRAAFKAVVDGGKQVAVLVPTTVLAMQHYESFKERMQHFPIKIGIASRFQTLRETRLILESVRRGDTDILVGTHRLVSKDVIFNDLGLVIIDEEQRFGVRAKEKLKHIKTGVDCLTMTATPIPRTLYLSLIHLREMSLINSPPYDRLPIKTILAEREDKLIKNALMRELARDGQAYYIHNRVESIHKEAEKLQKMLPSARLAIVHGQMDSDMIDKVFHSFKRGDTDILVATSIVENGVDIPNANTIIIDRADRFGVADLYQLRGRVGRWNRTAYAYFLVQENRVLPEITQKRLNALVETSGFGGGIKLAMRDLEIRGAGDILGVQQSGNVSNIGFHLYCKLLKKTIDALKKQQPTSFLETRIEFPYNAKIPDTYVHESSIRLELYHRLGEAENIQAVDTIYDEIKDRFGPIPQPMLWLYHLTRIRIFANINQFTELKFLKHTLTAVQKQKKNPLSKQLMLPPFETPRELEWLAIKRLTEAFRCPYPNASDILQTA